MNRVNEPADFYAGRDYPSPVEWLIGLDYYDGATSGVLRTAGGRCYAFDMIGEVRGDGQDLRRFELRPMPADSFDAVVAAITPHLEAHRPYWVPVWDFPDDTARRTAERSIDDELARAGPPSWTVEATDLMKPIVSAGPAAPPAYADPEQEYARLLRRLHSLDPDSPEADEVREAMDEPWYRMTPAQRERVRGLASGLNGRPTDDRVGDRVK